jgi:hypothetical protein
MYKIVSVQYTLIKLVLIVAFIYPKNVFDAQLYNFPGTNCRFNVGFNTSISVTFLKNQLTTDVEGLLYLIAVQFYSHFHFSI